MLSRTDFEDDQTDCTADRRDIECEPADPGQDYADWHANLADRP